MVCSEILRSFIYGAQHYDSSPHTFPSPSTVDVQFKMTWHEAPVNNECRREILTVCESAGHAGWGECVALLWVDELADRGQFVHLAVRRRGGAERRLRRQWAPGAERKRRRRRRTWPVIQSSAQFPSYNTGGSSATQDWVQYTMDQVCLLSEIIC